jgi:hypothetical protein
MMKYVVRVRPTMRCHMRPSLPELLRGPAGGPGGGKVNATDNRSVAGLQNRPWAFDPGGPRRVYYPSGRLLGTILLAERALNGGFGDAATLGRHSSPAALRAYGRRSRPVIAPRLPGSGQRVHPVGSPVGRRQLDRPSRNLICSMSEALDSSGQIPGTVSSGAPEHSIPHARKQGRGHARA